MSTVRVYIYFILFNVQCGNYTTDLYRVQEIL